MDVKISTKDLNLYYGANHALKNVSLDLYANKITAFIGPSGCGKSTYLKTLNRMNDLVPNVKIEGKVLLDGEDIYDPKVDSYLKELSLPAAGHVEHFDGAEAIRRADALMADYDAVLAKLRQTSAALTRAAGKNEELLLDMLEHTKG